MIVTKVDIVLGSFDVFNKLICLYVNTTIFNSKEYISERITLILKVLSITRIIFIPLGRVHLVSNIFQLVAMFIFRKIHLPIV